MEAVHNHTSTANQMEHQIFPNNHISKTSLMAEKGRTMMPSVKSAQAKETIEIKIYVSYNKFIRYQKKFESWLKYYWRSLFFTK